MVGLRISGAPNLTRNKYFIWNPYGLPAYKVSHDYFPCIVRVIVSVWEINQLHIVQALKQQGNCFLMRLHYSVRAGRAAWLRKRLCVQADGGFTL
jgi:hypothetical protein